MPPGHGRRRVARSASHILTTRANVVCYKTDGWNIHTNNETAGTPPEVPVDFYTVLGWFAYVAYILCELGWRVFVPAIVVSVLAVGASVALLVAEHSSVGKTMMCASVAFVVLFGAALIGLSMRC